MGLDSSYQNNTMPTFNQFFIALWGYTPFPWQQRLADQVVSSLKWPDQLDIPTGLGKTSVLDIAVYALAATANAVRTEGTLPVRYAYVIDRRTVVDQAYDRAIAIQSKIREATTGPLKAIKDQLSVYTGHEEDPLCVSILRGGITRDDEWVEHPRKPSLIISTVDQVGSRILFRGYGVSDKSKPIHAGLLGTDTCFMLDEVHLSIPFLQTLKDLKNIFGAQIQSIELSATHRGTQAGSVFRLDASDDAHPTVAKRKGADKLVVCTEPVKSFEEDTVTDAIRSLNAGHKVVAVVVNRVATAKKIFDLLGKALTKANMPVPHRLLTGRMRGCDRNDLESTVIPFVRAGRDRSKDTPFILVSTQCIEAGADFDFDYMITEAASSDALVQRFGRVNRFGEYGQSQAGVILQSGKIEDHDPIYGPAKSITYQFLKGVGKLNFGPSHLPTFPPNTKSPEPETLQIRKEDLDNLVQTNPQPASGPSVSDFLHGINRGLPDVQLIWRSGLVDASGNLYPDAVERVKLIPPCGVESVSVPFIAAQQWFLGVKKASEYGDVEGLESGEIKYSTKNPLGFPTILWAGEDTTVLSIGRDIKPGMTLVVPSEVGGIDPLTKQWEPTSKAPVEDRADELVSKVRNRVYLRVTGARTMGITPGLSKKDLLQALRRTVVDGSAGSLVSQLGNQVEVNFFDGDTTLFILGGKSKQFRKNTAEASHSHDIGFMVTLDDHNQDVANAAREYATLCGLEAETFYKAGKGHDLGKADPRFQFVLRNGDRVAVVSDTLLAKSDPKVYLSKAEKDAIYVQSGLPKGFRHEMLSVRILESFDLSTKLPDMADDILHLIASHHGYARPYAPVVEDSNPVVVKVCGQDVDTKGMDPSHNVGSGISKRFKKFVNEYGWYGSAYRESVFRLADHEGSRRGMK